MVQSLLRTLCVPLVLLGAFGCKKSGADFEGEIALQIQRPNSSGSEMVFSTSGGRVRLDSSVDGKHSHAIVRPGGKALLVMDEAQSWLEMDMQKAAAAMATADPNGAPGVRKTGEKETIAGRECEIWKIQHANGKRTETCITEGLAAFDFGALLPGASLLRPPASTPEAANEVRTKKMFPLRSIEFDPFGKELSRMVVTRIEAKKIDDSKFEVPANYKKFERP
ncbi:DUF4412 domain-containing protein [Pendulispora albinea]|uniref:DUF4412 domain-containing protein n=1 Tax=Pendulispora albinea TaxID=2741071 RepID=A0ABZ2M167_9BACT